MKLEFYNCPTAENIESVKLPEGVEFLSYRPDFEMMKKMAEGYKHYHNILVLGHGGSITSFYGMYNALILLTPAEDASSF